MKQKVNVMKMLGVLVVAVAAVWTCSGQGFGDYQRARIMKLIEDNKKLADDINKSLAENKRWDAELEAWAVRGYLYYEKLVNLNVGNFDEWGARRELTDAMRQGNWLQAVGLCELILVKTGREDPILKVKLTPVITRVSDYVTLAFLDLNAGRSDKAIANMETAIAMMQRKYGAETAQSAAAFLAEIRAGRAEITYPEEQVCGLTQAITAAAKVEDDVQMGRLNAMLDAGLAKAETRLRLARQERYRTTMRERARAKEEFRRNTGLDFDSTYRPSSEGAVQREWDWCEKILNIWKVVEKPN